MLKVDRVTKKYGTFKAVDHVSFSVNQGEVVGLLGQNGAGKTTILKMLSGSLEPDQGQIFIQHLDLSQHTQRLQKNLGYLPETLPIYPEMLVADYLDFAASLKGIEGRDKFKELGRVVEAVALEPKLTQPIHTLSRGYQQRVGVAQAILGQPKLILLDEPTNGLDPEQTQSMRDLIKILAQEATVILSTHIMQEVDATCTQVVMLDSGRLMVDSQLNDLKQTQHVIIETSLPEDKTSLLLNIKGVLDVQLEDYDATAVSYRYQLKTHQDESEALLLSSLSKVVIEHSEHLYRLQPVHRNLETLFKRTQS